MSRRNAQTAKYSDDRNGETYTYITIRDLYWMLENLRFKTENSIKVNDKNCGEFYPIEEAFSVCPEGWRLPNEKEVKTILKLDKKEKIHFMDTLNIKLCGRIDYDKHSKTGVQNTFWIDSELDDGQITHWHNFGQKQELHSHDVVNAKRKFPVRCVKIVDKVTKELVPIKDSHE